jgi:hypothetical protein
MQPSNPSSSSAIHWAGIISILAALLAVAADLALQYTSNMGYLLSRQSLYLLDVPPDRLFLGHYLGFIAILLETLGFWQVYRALQPAGERYALPFFLISAFSAMLGAAYRPSHPGDFGDCAKFGLVCLCCGLQTQCLPSLDGNMQSTDFSAVHYRHCNRDSFFSVGPGSHGTECKSSAVLYLLHGNVVE